MQHSDQQSQESVLERTQIVPQIDGDDDERRQNERSRVFQPRGGGVVEDECNRPETRRRSAGHFQLEKYVGRAHQFVA